MVRCRAGWCGYLRELHHGTASDLLAAGRARPKLPLRPRRRRRCRRRRLHRRWPRCDSLGDARRIVCEASSELEHDTAAEDRMLACNRMFL